MIVSDVSEPKKEVGQSRDTKEQTYGRSVRKGQDKQTMRFPKNANPRTKKLMNEELTLNTYLDLWRDVLVCVYAWKDDVATVSDPQNYRKSAQ